MGHSQRGFSLVEALVSLLVLSIGMLGLGQLQARLWKSAAQMRADAAAHAVCETGLERGISTAAVGVLDGSETIQSIGNTTVTTRLEAERQGTLETLTVSAEWHGPDGRSTARLTTRAVRSDPSDARWFLAPP